MISYLYEKFFMMPDWSHDTKNCHKVVLFEFQTEIRLKKGLSHIYFQWYSYDNNYNKDSINEAVY